MTTTTREFSVESCVKSLRRMVCFSFPLLNVVAFAVTVTVKVTGTVTVTVVVLLL